MDGDTASDGYDRVDDSVPEGTDGVIVEFGGNDMLQNVDPSVTRSALTGIVARLRQRRIPVMLAGMRSYPSRGAEYVRRFETIYPDLARSYGLVLYPFFLQGVYGNRSLMQADGIHPNQAGVQYMVQATLPSVERFIAGLGTHKGLRALSRARSGAPRKRTEAARLRTSFITTAAERNADLARHGSVGPQVGENGGLGAHFAAGPGGAGQRLPRLRAERERGPAICGSVA